MKRMKIDASYLTRRERYARYVWRKLIIIIIYRWPKGRRPPRSIIKIIWARKWSAPRLQFGRQGKHAMTYRPDAAASVPPPTIATGVSNRGTSSRGLALMRGVERGKANWEFHEETENYQTGNLVKKTPTKWTSTSISHTHIPAITFSNDDRISLGAQLNAVNMFRTRRQRPKSSVSVITVPTTI